jgi:hypothetical protein
MRQRTILWTAAAIVLIPIQVLAAPSACLSDQFGNGHLLEVLEISSGGLASIVGVLFFSASFNDVSSCPSAPLAGTAYAAADGKIRIGYSVFASTANCLPFLVQASFSLASGTATGILDEPGSGFSSPLTLTFTPSACSGPALAHQPARP